MVEFPRIIGGSMNIHETVSESGILYKKIDASKGFIKSLNFSGSYETSNINCCIIGNMHFPKNFSLEKLLKFNDCIILNIDNSLDDSSRLFVRFSTILKYDAVDLSLYHSVLLYDANFDNLYVASAKTMPL